MWEGFRDRTELQHIDPTLLAITVFLSSFPGLLNRGLGAQPLWLLVFSTASYLQLVWSPTAQSGAWGLPFLVAGFLYRILSPTGLVSKTDWISCALSYIIVQRPTSYGRHNFALIQPVHGQGYNILIIPRPDAPVIYTGALCERKLETEQNCNILTPTLLAITTFISRSPWLLNRGPVSLGAGFLYRILSPTCLISNWLTSSLHPGYIVIWRPLFFLRASQFPTHSTRPRSRLLYPDYSLTGCTCYLHRCISYFDGPAGS